MPPPQPKDDPGYASLVFLSYNRPQFIFEAIQSGVDNAGYPCEVIVNDDGSTAPGLLVGLLDKLAGHQVSRLVLNPPGHNEGVGTSINRAFAAASGDPVIKLDQDLLFTPGWLARVVGILRHDDAVGMLGLFKYDFEPVPWQRMKIDVPTHGGYHYTRQFCGSAFAIPRAVWNRLGPLEEHSDSFAEDIEYMQRVRGNDHELALPDVDLVKNRGFGIGPSTVVEEGHVVHQIHHGPFVFGRDIHAPPASEASDTHDFPLPNYLVENDRKFDVGVVITTCAGREENLKRTIDHLMRLKGMDGRSMAPVPRAIVVVYDGCSAMGFHTPMAVHGIEIPKHEPGHEQPRNVGFRYLRELEPDCNYVWFLDSDLIFEPSILDEFGKGLVSAEEDRILIGPYDFMAPGVTECIPERTGPRVGISDYRWVSFDEHGPEDVLVRDLGAGLACFGGNLIWPVEDFERVGGFHPELHHGRCEDGELGLRAASAGVPMSFVAKARGWHVWHQVNYMLAATRNARDVPLLNSWHPWVEKQGLVLSMEDGARFNWTCPDCGETVNSLDYWPHSAKHKGDGDGES